MNLILFVSVFSIWTALVRAQVVIVQQNCMTAFKQSAFTSTNTIRSFHSSQPLTTSSALEGSAQAYADKLATTKVLAYSGIANVGENIFDKKATKAQDKEFCTSIQNYLFLY